MTVHPRTDWTQTPPADAHPFAVMYVKGTAIQEIWRPVPGYEGHYEVSDIGRVRSLKTTPPRIKRADAATRNGYPVVTLWIANKGVTKYVHALVALAFIGPKPEGQEVRHLDDVKTNCLLTNITYGTRTENMLDRVRNGIHNNGNSVKTHCPRNHPYNETNTYTSAKGQRSCRLCRQINKRARRLALQVSI